MASSWKLLVAVGCTLAATCMRTPPAPVEITTAGVPMEADRTRALESIVGECPRGSRECGPSGGPKLRLATGPVPDGAAGFELGTTENDAKMRCFDAGQMWSAHARRVVECSGSAGAKIPFHVELQLGEEGNICRIILSQYLPAASEALERFGVIEDELTTKYGPPGARELDVPDACAKDATLAACLEDGRAKAELDWIWGTDHAVTARLVAPSSKYVFLFVVYSDPAMARAVQRRSL